MRFQTPLIPGRLVKRYKRFLADIQLDDGALVTAHCANPGSMLGLKEPGLRVWVESNDDPKKKLNYGWRLVEHDDGHFTGVDTSVPNRALKAALFDGAIPELSNYQTIRPEVRFGEASRVDFLLTADGEADCYMEVKCVTLRRVHGLGEFPDSVTARGAKHLRELAKVSRDGHRALMFYLVQRTDCDRVTLATDIDPAYAAEFALARAAGVEVMSYDTVISPEAIEIGRALPFIEP